MNENYFDKIKDVFDKLPYQFNVTEVCFEMYRGSVQLDSAGSYDVRRNNKNKYDVIQVIGPYGLDIKNFNNIFVKYNEEKNNCVGYLWMPTIIYDNLDELDKSFLLENFENKSEELIKEKIDNLNSLLMSR